MKLLKIIILFLLTTIIYAKPLEVNEQTKAIEILSKSQVYIDNSRTLTINEIKIKNFMKTVKNYWLLVIHPILTYGLNLLFIIVLKKLSIKY